jgi:hypothetical protein
MTELVITGTASPYSSVGDEATTTADAFSTLTVINPAPLRFVYVTESVGAKSAVNRVFEFAAFAFHEQVATKATAATLLQPAMATPPDLKVTDPPVLTCAATDVVIPYTTAGGLSDSDICRDGAT